jgi:hypothetical protein
VTQWALQDVSRAAQARRRLAAIASGHRPIRPEQEALARLSDAIGLLEIAFPARRRCPCGRGSGWHPSARRVQAARRSASPPAAATAAAAVAAAWAATDAVVDAVTIAVTGAGHHDAGHHHSGAP